MPATEILNNLNENKINPIYFLQGDESFYIDEVSDYIENNILNETEIGFNQTIMYGKDCKMHEVLTNAKRFPMMAERQVVIVKEAHLLGDFKNKEGRALLEAYVNNPLPSTILVFCYKYGKLDGKTTLAKSLKKNAVVLSSDKLRDYQVPKWILSYLSKKGYKITELATQLLTDHIGNSLERLSNEIDKLLINLTPETIIDDAIIEKNIGISKDYNVFELQNAILFRDILKANKIVKYFGANPKDHHPIPIIALLYSLFNKLLIVHQSKDKSPQNLAKVLKVNPFFVKDYLTGARNYPFYAVMKNIEYVYQADLEVKGIYSPSLSGENILKQLVFKLIH
ncbi:MAG: DNA polymerase III subunit delta [Bacteroidetes bacterium]|nr:MAG: DNA polymerase III subunit delta [Bacteroidota bacterium]